MDKGAGQLAVGRSGNLAIRQLGNQGFEVSRLPSCRIAKCVTGDGIYLKNAMSSLAALSEVSASALVKILPSWTA
jgi:hypothetical protein